MYVLNAISKFDVVLRILCNSNNKRMKILKYRCPTFYVSCTSCISNQIMS